MPRSWWRAIGNPDAIYDYRWVITSDAGDEDGSNEETNAQSSVGQEGPFNLNPSIPLTHEFRIVDEDDNVYATGQIGGDFEGNEPVDDYGAWNWGATDTQYLEGGVWTDWQEAKLS